MVATWDTCHNEDLIRYAGPVRAAPPEAASWRRMRRPSAGTAPTGTRSWRRRGGARSPPRTRTAPE